MSLLTEGTSASERRRKQDLKTAVLALLDEMTRQGQAARYSEVVKRIGEQSSVNVEDCIIILKGRGREEGCMSGFNDEE